MIDTTFKTTKERMRYILETRGVTVYALCNGSTERGKISNQIYKDTALTENTIQLFLQYFEDVSADWLLRGRGPTYHPQATHTYITNNTYNGGGENNLGVVNVGSNTGNITIPTYNPAKIPSPAELGLVIKDVVTELRLKAIIYSYEQTIDNQRKHIKDLEDNQDLLHAAIKAMMNK